MKNSSTPSNVCIAMEGIQSCVGAIHIGASVAWAQRKFGHVLGIPLIHPGQFGPFIIEEPYHTHGHRKYCIGAGTSDRSRIHCGRVCHFGGHTDE